MEQWIGRHRLITAAILLPVALIIGGFFGPLFLMMALFVLVIFAFSGRHKKGAK